MAFVMNLLIDKNATIFKQRKVKISKQSGQFVVGAGLMREPVNQSWVAQPITQL